MFISQKPRKKASARLQINIKGVRDGILLLPRRQYRLTLEVSPVNFELKSDEEQDVLIDTYESFLNALPCPLQIITRIREHDMGKYLSDLEARFVAENQEIYRRQIRSYSTFVQRLVTRNKILSRHFYVVLPYESSDDDFEAAKTQLSLNADIVTKGLARLGMQSRRLPSLEVLDLFHSFYNPNQAKAQPISGQVAELLTSSYVRGLQ
ncbi:MAG TPA: TraC family protein [Candidatus Saccharimonadales bacterium]|nr:TraC family protein [Candidatus Saccharimonadales bacterium]